MAKNTWKHSHNYDRTTVMNASETFEGSRCTTCGEHKAVTRLRNFLSKRLRK